MDMGLSAWSQSPTCQNAQLTACDCQSRTKNGHGMISMVTVTNIPECTTYPLWLPEQDKEWTWDDQHDHTHQHARIECRTHKLWLPEQDKEWTWNDQLNQSHQHARMHNSQSMIARAGQTMDMGWSAWSWHQHPRMYNSPPIVATMKENLWDIH